MISFRRPLFALYCCAVLGLAVLGLAAGCSKPEPDKAPPLLVVGIDGGEWQVIERLWQEGRLPVLRSLAERGVQATLDTDYAASPVIWTTIATGRLPRDHGITDFVVPTPRGDVPVSSDLRRVPALWNMASTAGRRVAALGWWASWPAESIDGVMVTDRVLLDIDQTFYPPERSAWLDERTAAVTSENLEPNPFEVRSDVARRDRLKGRLAVDLVQEAFDLWMVYFRNADVVSHTEWKYFDPDPFGTDALQDLTPEERASRASAVPASYEAIDQALGDILAVLPPEANVLVVSDHGFEPETKEIAQVIFDLDAVLERLGYLARDEQGAVDFRRTQVYSYRSPKHKKGKTVRFSLAGREPGGNVLPRDQEALRQRLGRDLQRVTYDNGEPIFWLRDARPPETRLGADFVIGVTNDVPSRTLWLDGQPFEGPVEGITRITGTHDADTQGIFLAAGPDIDPNADLAGIDIHDLAGTILYGMGLPAGEDFAGTVRTNLFRESFRESYPLRTVKTWGRRDISGRATETKADAELLEELGALGYLN